MVFVWSSDAHAWRLEMGNLVKKDEMTTYVNQSVMNNTKDKQMIC